LTTSAGSLDPSSLRSPAQLYTPIHSASVGTHRNRSDTSIPQGEENTSDYAANMIAKALRSQYTPPAGSDAFQLPLKRAFHHLDWRRGGWLARAVVEEQCYRAADKIKFNISRSELAKVVKAEDEKGGKPDHNIDEQEFINIVLFIRDELRSGFERQAIAKGLGEAAAEIKRWQENQSVKTVSLLWKSVKRYRKAAPRSIKEEHVFTHRFGGDIAPQELPLARNATYAIYLAVKYCVTSVEGAFHRLRPVMMNWTVEEEAEVVEVLNTTLETAAQFHRFESPDGIRVYHWIDKFIDEASLVPLSKFPDLQGCPLEKAISLVANIWSLLDKILGLVSDIQDFAYGTPALLHWREAHVLERAKNLTAQASGVLSEESTSIFEEIDKWHQQHQTNLLNHPIACQNMARTLKKEQLEAVRNNERYKINIVLAYLNELPRIHGFRMWRWAFF
jgi:hypothetical protein